MLKPQDRRIHSRYKLWIPARLEGESGPVRLAVGHDISQGGALLVTSGQPAPGDRVQLFVRIPPNAEDELEICATVLRVEPNSEDPNGIWPFQIALEFDRPQPDLEATMREHSRMLEGMADAGEQTPR
jgi:hypothetical protein